MVGPVAYARSPFRFTVRLTLVGNFCRAKREVRSFRAYTTCRATLRARSNAIP
jgi:hypothetical protein